MIIEKNPNKLLINKWVVQRVLNINNPRILLHLTINDSERKSFI